MLHNLPLCEEELHNQSRALRGSASRRSLDQRRVAESILDFIEGQKSGRYQGLPVLPEHEGSIWDTSCIPERYVPATDELMDETERRLNVKIPESLRKNLRAQNGGYLLQCAPVPFLEKCWWTNATADGIEHLQEWKLASEHNWFESVDDLDNLDLLVCIAGHSESHLCLDYRSCGRKGTPAVTYVDVCQNPTKVVVVAKSIDEFIKILVESCSRESQNAKEEDEAQSPKGNARNQE